MADVSVVGDTASVIFIPIGVSKPVPMACSSRPPSNVAKFGANAPIMEPTTMMPVTEINSALVEIGRASCRERV